jgi:DNA helicase-2/ATP-dependent DNA helicase PcrA
MNPLLHDLTEPQREAVLHRDGPLLVLAGPGSGKTRVITHRIAHLLSNGVWPSQILALTFTNKAADEMQRRVAELAPGKRVWLSTFHRFGAKLLRQHAELVGLAPNFTIYDTGDVRQTIKRVIEAHSLKTLHFTPDRLAGAISDAKNKLITADRYEPRPGSTLSQVVAEVYPRYQQRMLASSAVDFDDLLLHVAQLLHDNAELRAELDERFRYVLVDEYQDTNRAQYVILRALSHDHPNLAVTGDPDQSIYGWRGADLNNILEFERDFPEVRIVRLERNYRSTKRILRIADELIAHNFRRKQKRLWTENDEGAAVRLVLYGDQDHEANGIAERIQNAIAAGRRRPSDFAIFYRVNALSRGLEQALRKARVPFQMVRGQEFYARKEIKDVLAYCQLVNNPRDDIAFERTVNTPPRGIGKKTIDRLNLHAYQHGLPLLEAARDAALVEGLTKGTAAKVLKFVAIVDRISAVAHGDVEEVIGTVLEASGYRASLAESDDEQDQNRLANIEELLTDARGFDEQQRSEASETDGASGGGLEGYLERAWLVNETDSWDADTDKVTLMTLHAAKGLEFPVVFIVAVEDGVLPHERVGRHPDELEEERRLAFVGLTRAEEELQLSYAVTRDFRGVRRRTIPSSFLMEMPREELELVDEATAYIAHREQEKHGDLWDDGESMEDWIAGGEHEEDEQEEDASTGDWQLDQVTVQFPDEAAPSLRVSAAAITTAAALAGDQQKAALPRVSPDVFQHGMTVMHPEYGPGKIVALSGSGKGRRATIQFATVGEKKIILAHSSLRPVR